MSVIIYIEGKEVDNEIKNRTSEEETKAKNKRDHRNLSQDNIDSLRNCKHHKIHQRNFITPEREVDLPSLSLYKKERGITNETHRRPKTKYKNCILGDHCFS